MIYFQKFDFIVTSKFINELIDKLDNVYSNFAASFSAILDIKGLIIITDTTDKRINRGAEVWIPKIMNSDLNSNIGVNADIGTIMPPPCNCTGCNEQCYTCFENEYSCKGNDSRITFRILAKKIVQTGISYKKNPNNYVVSKTKSGVTSTCRRLNYNGFYGIPFSMYP
jgi:hypothetical protein